MNSSDDIPSTERYTLLSTVFKDCVNRELHSTPPEYLPEIADWLIDIREAGLSYFWAPVSVTAISDKLSRNVLIRNYVLSLSDRLTATLALAGYNSHLFTPIKDRIVANHSARQSDATTIPQDVGAAITMPESDLQELLSSNPHLLVLYLSLVLSSDTELIATAKLQAGSN